MSCSEECSSTHLLSGWLSGDQTIGSISHRHFKVIAHFNPSLFYTFHIKLFTKCCQLSKKCLSDLTSSLSPYCHCLNPGFHHLLFRVMTTIFFSLSPASSLHTSARVNSPKVQLTLWYLQNESQSSATSLATGPFPLPTSTHPK